MLNIEHKLTFTNGHPLSSNIQFALKMDEFPCNNRIHWRGTYTAMISRVRM